MFSIWKIVTLLSLILLASCNSDIGNNSNSKNVKIRNVISTDMEAHSAQMKKNTDESKVIDICSRSENIQKLIIEKLRIPDGSCSVSMKDLSTIKKIIIWVDEDIANNTLSDGDFDNINNLEELSFSTNSKMDLSDEHQAFITKTISLKIFSNLKKLSFKNLKLNNDIIKSISSLKSLSSIETLNLYDVDLNDESIGYISDSDTLSKLKRLNVSNNKIGYSGIKKVLESYKLRGLKSLIANNCDIIDQSKTEELLISMLLEVMHIAGNKSPKFLTSLLLNKSMKNLKDLNLENNGLIGEHFNKLLNSDNMLNVKYLNLGSNILGLDGVESLRKSDKLISLSWLFMQNCSINSNQIKTLAQSEKIKNITHFYLGKNPIGDNGLLALLSSELISHTGELGIVHMDFNDCSITSEGIINSFSNGYLSNKIIDFRNNEISAIAQLILRNIGDSNFIIEKLIMGASDINAIADSPELLSLNVLNLNGSNSTENDLVDSIKYLMNSKNVVNIKEFNFSSTKIGDDGLLEIFNHESAKNIEVLILNSVYNIKAESVRKLIKKINSGDFPSLKKVDLKFNSLLAMELNEEVKEFNKNHNCQIELL